jgi:transposase
LSKRTFPKLGTVCDTQSYLILAALAEQGPFPDNPQFEPLVRESFARVRFARLLADAGYDGEPAHCLVRDELGAQSVIPAIRRHRRGKLPAGKYRRKMATRFPRKHYGQRWQIEATYSQDKRRFGSQIAASTLAGQFRELMLRVLVHNLAIIITAIRSFQPSRTVPRRQRRRRGQSPFSYGK